MKKFLISTVIALSLTVVEVKKWSDYDDTSVQIETKDGQVYLTDFKNVVLIGD